MKYPELDLALARRLEHAEAQAAVESADALQRMRPGAQAAVERIAGGVAVFTGVDSPLTQAVEVGLWGPVTAEELDNLESFYTSRGDAVRVELCPLADASVIELFGKRNYGVTEFSNVLLRPLSLGETWAGAPRGLVIEKIGEKDAELWAGTVAQGFAEQFPVTPQLLEVVQMFAYCPGAECYLARWEAEPAGGSSLSLRDGVAGLFGASTLPAFRKRGIQTALLHHRLARGVAEGCDIAMSIAQPGSASHRNIERQGFRVAYTRVKFQKGKSKQAL